MATFFYRRGKKTWSWRISLNPQHHWNDNGAFGGLLEEEARDRVGDGAFDKIKVDGVGAVSTLLNGFFDDEASLTQKLLRLAQINKATRDDVGRFAQFASFQIDDGNDDEHAVLCQHLAIAHHHLLHISDGETVYHHW